MQTIVELSCREIAGHVVLPAYCLHERSAFPSRKVVSTLAKTCCVVDGHNRSVYEELTVAMMLVFYCKRYGLSSACHPLLSNQVAGKCPSVAGK